MNLLQIIAIVFAVSYCYLATKQNNWCWCFALVSNVIHIYIFYETSLPQQAFLYIFYTLLPIYGFYQWHYKKRQFSAVAKLTNTSNYSLILLIVVLSFFSVKFLDISLYKSNNLLIIDSISLWSSIIATVLQTHKKINNWWYWLIINTLNVYLFWHSQLYYLIALSFIYNALAIYGIIQWQKFRQEIVKNK